VPAPVYGCGCGIYALKAPEAALECAQMARRDLAKLFPDLKLPPGPMCLTDLKRPPGLAWGAVKIWGRIIEHESGYRAEFAYPSSLHCDDAELARRVAALYGVACDYTPNPGCRHGRRSAIRLRTEAIAAKSPMPSWMIERGSGVGEAGLRSNWKPGSDQTGIRRRQRWSPPLLREGARAGVQIEIVDPRTERRRDWREEEAMTRAVERIPSPSLSTFLSMRRHIRVGPRSGTTSIGPTNV
jgi:hypothetical protein